MERDQIRKELRTLCDLAAANHPNPWPELAKFMPGNKVGPANAAELRALENAYDWVATLATPVPVLPARKVAA